MSATETRVRAPRGRASRKTAAAAEPVASGNGAHAPPAPALPPQWREFVGRWLEASECTLRAAARGDWEVELSPALQRRWRRQRVRLVFDPQRPTLPRGAWFTAPGSTGGRKILEAIREAPAYARRTALPHVPGAPEDGLQSLIKVRGLSWGIPRLGPVRYERRVAFHATVTRWGGMPSQEPWVLLVGPDGEAIEWARETELLDIRTRDGLYQINEELELEHRVRWFEQARAQFEHVLGEREKEWEHEVGRLREAELDRLGAFFSARIEEEEERLRRRTSNGDEADLAQGDATSLKLEWERRAAEVRQRWALRTEVRLWGVQEWSWPIADLEQEVKAGAMHVKLTSRVDVARARPALPACPTCHTPAEMLVRSRGAVRCAACA
jgi:hypothetical protein